MKTNAPRALTVWASAKLNLTLEILGKRPDGYHEIRSVMQKISLFDTLRLFAAPRISAKSNLKYLPCDSRNLCVRAAERYFAATGISGGVHIDIRKEIPVGAGLGGGSADAAAALLGLEKLYEPLDAATRMQIAKELGADVPFCVSEAKSCLCEGVGEVLRRRVQCGGRIYVLLVKEGRKLSTADVYADFDACGTLQGAPPDHDGMLAALSAGEASGVAARLSNQLEQSVLPRKPHLQKRKQQLLSCGAAGVLMSGAGPVVYGIFAQEKACCDAAAALKAQGAAVRRAYFLP